MKSTLSSLIAIAASIGIFSASVCATPLSYDEASDGDIANRSVTFALDFGANVVTGNVSCLTACDFDIFDATLPANAILQSIDLVLMEGAGGNGSIADWFEASNGSGSTLVFQNLSATGTFSFPINQELSGLTSVGLNSLPTGMSNDYTITLNVISSAVPIPATLALLGLGIAGIGYGRRKQVEAV